MVKLNEFTAVLCLYNAHTWRPTASVRDRVGGAGSRRGTEALRTGGPHPTRPYAVSGRRCSSQQLLLVLAVAAAPASALRLTGTWRTDSFFLFLAKFGFQRTRSPNRHDTEGHIFGNVTSASGAPAPALLAVLDRTFFIDYYTNRSWADRDTACRRMFAQLGRVAYDSRCFDDGEEDFLRRVPCAAGELCPDEDAPANVVPGHQFTYSIQDVHQPRFWYLSLVACHRDPQTCEWRHTRQPITIEYDIWLVNGNPHNRAQNPLEYQFSFDEQDTVEVHLAFMGLYTLLAPFQLYASLQQRHSLTRLFTASLITGLAGWLLRAVHSVKMALDGVGIQPISIGGDCLNMAAQLQLMLVLMLLAQGWTVRDPLVSGNRRLLAVWSVYGLISVLLYVWNRTEVDVIYDIDEYQTWPGWLALALRLAIMCWFLWELRATMAGQRAETRLQFLLHFGAASLLWFLYLPVVALIALTISALWRHKLLLALSGSADFLAFAIMTHLLWPARSRRYFQLDTPDLDVFDELEEFSQATHVLLSAAPLPDVTRGAARNGASLGTAERPDGHGRGADTKRSA
ncbi:integral membrane protein GPR180-like [Pollicipes pollicipes]|uniref:integral membrane protein GPR180-like n=1 Tax=Pollicipes pollicipes TaxID=41117 RepID=UPI0018853A8C|nr:integral membrane protein GPR180-like [Pollicipes pollicipes]